MFRHLSSWFPALNKVCAEQLVQNAPFTRSINFSEIMYRPIRSLHQSSIRFRKKDRRSLLQGVSKKDEGTDGESRIDIDSLGDRRFDMFPTENTATQLFDGIPFNQVPICNIRVSRNNTIISISKPSGVVELIRSCGIEGFKNARKGTNIAAQATAISFSTKALEKGFKTIRVKVQGLGPGRMSSIKGLQMAGMNIISITDDTRISWNPPRPRKQRRL